MAYTPCFTFEETLHVPGVPVPAGSAYGVAASCANCPDNDCCGEPWTSIMIQQWWSAVKNAERQIVDYLGKPICPTEICKERHRLRCPIYLKHGPVAYLGKRVDVGALTLDINNCNLQPCPTEPLDCTCLQDGCLAQNERLAFIPIADVPEGATVTAEFMRFEHVQSNCDDRYYPRELAEPCISEEYCDLGLGAGSELIGYILKWELYQLVLPKAKRPVKIGADDCFASEILVTFEMIDETQAATLAKPCKCCENTRCSCGQYGCCCGNPDAPTITATLGDEQAGEVCLTKESGSDCTCNISHVYMCYGTDLSCYGSRDDLLEAVVKLAITKLSPHMVDSCSCDDFKESLSYWREVDPIAGQEFASKMRWGGSRGGMDALRILKGFRERMDNPFGVVTSGGMMRKRGRDRNGSSSSVFGHSRHCKSCR